MSELLSAQSINKSYGGAVALQSACFDLALGEVHALMGENGAGKSTLSRILAGSLRADSGKITLNGASVTMTSPRAAHGFGIGMIYQELDLFPHLSVAENVVIGNLQLKQKGLVSRSAMRRFSQPFLQQVGLCVDPDAWIASLSITEQQLVAIARALSMRCRILVMDEPTSALPQDTAERLFGVIAALKLKGVAIIYVSHKMDEIFQLCDRVTVLRDGETIGTREIPLTNREELIRMMVGRTLSAAPKAVRSAQGEPMLTVSNLSTDKLKGVSFNLARGEVLGIAGLVGAGRSELGAALFGLDKIRHGTMTLKGMSYLPAGPAQAQEKGLGLLPEDRKHQGLMPQMSVLENSTLTVLSKVARFGFLRTADEERLFESAAHRLQLKCATSAMAVANLSGGNQQKTLLARWLLVDPDVFFLDDPARGIDVAAKEDIYRLIEELAARGKSVLLASSELPELLRCSDRIMVLNDGRVSGLFSRAEATQELIMAAATRAPLELAG
jgi:ribose transport system ATP-binding protein